MYNSSLFTPALLRTHSFVFFTVHETCRIFVSPFISKASKFLHSFWVSSFHSNTLLHATLALSLVIFSLKLVCCSDALITCPLFNLLQNSIEYSPSSVIRDQGMRTYLPAPVTHSEWVCGTPCHRSPLPWSCRRWWVGCIYSWLGLGDPPAVVVLPPKWLTGWCHQHSEGSWLFTLQFVVHLEIHRGFPSSPSLRRCWTSMEKGHNLIGNHSHGVLATLTLASCFLYSLASNSISSNRQVHPITTDGLAWFLCVFVCRSHLWVLPNWSRCHLWSWLCGLKEPPIRRGWDPPQFGSFLAYWKALGVGAAAYVAKVSFSCH